MPDPIAVLVRFNGDPDDLFDRFERARRLWIESQPDDYARPIFYAACKTNGGIVIVNAWETQAAHHAFGRRLGPYLEAVGLERPEQHEHLRIEKLGWTEVRLRPTEARAANDRQRISRIATVGRVTPHGAAWVVPLDRME